jgi:allantoicase/malate synthase/CubicO group peptidase (beta-lactamase class C family)
MQPAELDLDIPSYANFLPDKLLYALHSLSATVPLVDNLRVVGGVPIGQDYETIHSLQFACKLYTTMRQQLGQVLQQREQDRDFIDRHTKICTQTNKSLGLEYDSARFRTIIGLRDSVSGEVVVGPKQTTDGSSSHSDIRYALRQVTDRPIAPLPRHLQGEHITLFGPPDSPKMAINAMNCAHRALPDEPSIITELVESSLLRPKWGADDEDSKTPLRKPMLEAAMNLNACFERSLEYSEPHRNKHYKLASSRLAEPIKRIPGLALPSTSHFFGNSPLPLHLLDFALHAFNAWSRPEALTFYVPKIETEKEATYLNHMIANTEMMLKKLHPNYQLGTIRIILVLENARAVFRVNEIVDNLYPYFAGASLGWHDYLASTARLFAHDPFYRIPVKADPNIVIKHIKESHVLLSTLLKPRGAIKIGGMYGILPNDNSLVSDSFQVTIAGFIRDVIIQLRRGLDGFWIAHPDFVRIGIAVVHAWKCDQQQNQDQTDGASNKASNSLMAKVVNSLIIDPSRRASVLSFIYGEDVQGLDSNDPLYARALLAADVSQSNIIANNDPQEVHYNVFQCLQYLTDWLSGNGCVALPATVEGVAVRVMDDLATTERSRWEIWHEIHHGRFPLADFLRIVYEEMHFIRYVRRRGTKIVQVHWNEQTAKWYPVAQKLLILLMTEPEPVEFVTELLMPFAVDIVRESYDPWATIVSIVPEKYAAQRYIESFNHFFEACGCQRFADSMAKMSVPDLNAVERYISTFEKKDIIEVARFHVPFDQPYLTSNSSSIVTPAVAELSLKYKEKFGYMFMSSIDSANSIDDFRGDISTRLQNTPEQEIHEVRDTLFRIAAAHLQQIMKHQSQNTSSLNSAASGSGLLRHSLSALLSKYHVAGMSIAMINGDKDPETDEIIVHEPQTLSVGIANRERKKPVESNTVFEIASLSKTIAVTFALEYLVRGRGYSIDTPVNVLLSDAKTSFRLEAAPSKPVSWGDAVTLRHLCSQCAGLGMHYVNGIPLTHQMPSMLDLLQGKFDKEYGYQRTYVELEPGTTFKYSGAAFMVIQHILESFSEKPIETLIRPWLDSLDLQELTFDLCSKPSVSYASGYFDDGSQVPHSRLKFPCFAAGGLATTRALAIFWKHLINAFHNPYHTEGISHDTAVLMLHADADKGSRAFMAADMGLGCFIAEAGPNRLALHQAANEGFRGVYVMCYSGPNAGNGFVLISNGDDRAVLLNSAVSQELLLRAGWQGVDKDILRDMRWKVDSYVNQFDKVSQAEIVNQAYRALVFSAFEEDLPEEINPVGAPDPLACHNLVVGATLIRASNQRFARAMNLISARLPRFDPTAFGRHGKVMDSWETVRHNPSEYDVAEFKLAGIPKKINYIAVSTAFHDGNHAEFVQVDGLDESNGKWVVLVPKSKLEGHSMHRYTLKQPRIVSTVRVRNYPDGGISRLAMFDGALPATTKKLFPHPGSLSIQRITEPIPAVQKVMSDFSSFHPTEQDIQQSWQVLSTGTLVDISSAKLGGAVIHVTNQHYGPAHSVLAPFKPQGMFDGFETARCRIPDGKEHMEIQLAVPSSLDSILVDFTYFVNNNPRELAIEGLDMATNKWIPIVERMHTKHYRGNKLLIQKGPTFKQGTVFSRMKIYSFPCGGYNRVHVYSRVTAAQLQAMQKQARL